MPAPRDIIDSLESVISIYFSDVRHKLRAAFLLADELVEATGKAQIAPADAVDALSALSLPAPSQRRWHYGGRR